MFKTLLYCTCYHFFWSNYRSQWKEKFDSVFQQQKIILKKNLKNLSCEPTFHHLSKAESYVKVATHKLNGLTSLVADPTPANSTTDTKTLIISHGQPVALYEH